MSDQNDPVEEDFATLFAASAQTKRVENGQTVDGTIVAIGPEVAFVDVGGKAEADIAIDELKNEAGVLEAEIGDRIQAVVVSTTGASRSRAGCIAARRRIARSKTRFARGLPVEGKVEAPGQGRLQRRASRSSAPSVLARRSTRPATSTRPSHIGRVYAFRIIEYREDGRNFVVSRRALLEEDQKARAEEVRRIARPSARS